MSMFGSSDAQSDFARAVKLFETVIGGFGLDPQKCRIQTNDGSTAYSLLRGSAEVLIFLNPTQQANRPNFVRMVSPLWRLPPDNHLNIFRRLLELNARDLYGTAFGLMGKDNVLDAVLVTERPTTDMDRGEVEEMLGNIGAAGDFFDDKLVSEFGGTRLSDLHKH